jgi:hypothetical protein
MLFDNEINARESRDTELDQLIGNGHC